MFDRSTYLEKLAIRRNDGLIKVITGVRRVGKSYLLNVLFYEYLLNNGVNKDHIIKFAFDSLKDIQSIGDSFVDSKGKAKKVSAQKFMTFIYDKVKEKGPYYLLLDEIQNLEMFEVVLNGFLHDLDCDIYVTGSNSRFLSNDVLTEFEGRGEEVHIYPLTIKEYSEGTGKSIQEVWKEYIVTGGIPLIANMKDEEQKKSYLINLCSEVYIKDVIVRNNLKKPRIVSDLFDVISSTMASITNPLKITNTFNALTRNDISNDSVTKYLNLFEEAYLTKRVKRFDVEGRKYINATSKYYFEDIGIRNARLDFKQINDTHIMENIIYNELRFRGFRVDIGMITKNVRTERLDKNNKPIYIEKNYEIDFVASKADSRYYIQAAYSIADETKLEQERRSLLEIKDSFRKFIIVHDDIKTRIDDKGIIIMNVFEFLSNIESLRI